MAACYQELLEMLKRETARQLPEIEENGDWLWHHPETGFKEFMTQEYCLSVLKRHGLEAVTYPGTTGFTCVADSGKPGPCIGILGEMDSVVCFDHPDCNKETGAAHACGHSIQMATAMGAFLTLAEGGFLEKLCGKVMLIAVPAEECLEMEWRLNEIREGRLHYLGGKAELLCRGAFDGVDAVISTHAGTGNSGTITTCGSHNGFVAKMVTFKGRSAHAAAGPDKGINALYMANTALTALNGIRETFRDEDCVRIHPIITKGGDIVNAIPEEVRLESQVRAKKLDAVMDASEKFDRAMGGGAYAFGGQVVISNQPGYLPYTPTRVFDEIAVEVTEDVLGAGKGGFGAHTSGSEDLGDLNSIIPSIMANTNFMSGSHHAADYQIADRKIYEATTLFLGALACKLLDEDGKMTEAVKKAHEPLFKNVKEYCDFVDQLFYEKVLP